MFFDPLASIASQHVEIKVNCDSEKSEKKTPGKYVFNHLAGSFSHSIRLFKSLIGGIGYISLAISWARSLRLCSCSFLFSPKLGTVSTSRF